MRTRTAASAAAVLTAGLLLAGCSSNNTSDTGQEAKPDDTVTAATEKAEEETEDTGDKAVGLTQAVTYDDDVEVSLTGFTRGVSSEFASPQNTPYIKFTIKVNNGGKATIDLNEMYLSCLYGNDAKPGEQIFDEGLDMPTTHLRPGRSISVTTACELPKGEEYVQIELTPTAESETAIFAGNVKA